MNLGHNNYSEMTHNDPIFRLSIPVFLYVLARIFAKTISRF